MFCLSANAEERLHYSMPVSNQTFDADHKYSIGSKEYWFETSGAELNKGVELNNTSPRVLMLISQARNDAAPRVSNNKKLDVGLMQLVSGNDQVVDSKHVSEPQLAQTGFFSKSAAIFTDKSATDMGPLRLKTTQALNPDDKFLVMVREPDSNYVLNLSTTSQSIDHNRTTLASVSIDFPSLFKFSNEPQKPITYKAVLIGVDGSKTELKSQYKNGKLSFLRPKLDNIIAPINGLYELLVEAKGYRNGIFFHRKGKLALAFSQPTASIFDDEISANDIENAKVQIMVETYSRFEVRAILYGTNSSGDLVPVMESHVADDLNPGLAKLALKFDPKILAKAGVKAPYKIDNIRLYDQNQMAMLEEKNKPLADLNTNKRPRLKW